MSAMTDYTEALLANFLLRGTGTPPSAVYIGLFVSPGPNDASVTPYSDDNEVATGSGNYPAYTRKAVTFSAPTGGSGVVSNNGDSHATPSGNGNPVVFPANSGGGAASITITHWGIFDAATNGNLLAYGALPGAGKTIDVSDVPSFPPGALQLTFA